MTRIGKQPINIPAEVVVKVADGKVEISGPKGVLTYESGPGIRITPRDGQLLVSGEREVEWLTGTTRNILANMVKGVTEGWSKTLEISGTGYRAVAAGKDLTLTVGFSHPVRVIAPEGISFEVKENKIVVVGADKYLVGEVAAGIRKIKPPDPYKGKGIKYVDEKIRRKAGKTAKVVGAATGGTK